MEEWKEADKDNDGLINTDEFKELLIKLLSRSTKKHIQQLAIDDGKLAEPLLNIPKNSSDGHKGGSAEGPGTPSTRFATN